MKKLSYFLLVVCGLAAVSCEKKQEAPEYLPVLADKDGRWGLVSPSGEMLFSEEFKNEPTKVYNGRFFVENSEGLYELYTAEAQPKKVGAEYKEVGVFFEDVAPVVEKGKPIDFIDKDGNVKFTLKDVDGVPVENVRNFYDGVAIFQTEKGYGLVNTQGEVLLKNYAELDNPGDGKVWAMERKYAGMDEDSAKICLLTYKGEKLFEVSAGKYKWVSPFNKGYSAVKTETADEEIRAGIIDEKGEWVVRPTGKYHSIGQFWDEKFIYSDGESYGLTSFDGEVLLRPKYDLLMVADEKTLITGSQKDNEMFFIDLEGNRIGNASYEGILPILGTQYAWGIEGKHSYILIDLKGEPVNKQQSFYDIVNPYNGHGNYIIESDYTDLAALLESTGLNADGMKELNFNSDKEALLRFLDIEPYQYRQHFGEVELKNKFNNQKVNYYMTVGLSKPLIGRKSKGWWFYDYFAEDTSVAYFEVCFKNRSRLEGQMEALYEAAKQQAENLGGKETEKTEQHTCYSLGHNKLLVLQSEAEVVLVLEKGDGKHIRDFLDNYSPEDL